MNTIFRIREWLADRLPGAQYPRQEFIPANNRQSLFTWKYPMPLHQRIAIALLSILALAVLVPVLIVVLWVFVSVVFSG